MVTLKDGAGRLIGVAGPVGQDGNWTIIPSSPLPDGTALVATAKDQAGNVSGPGAGVVDIDALLISGAIDSVGPTVGLISDGSVSNDNSPQLTGTLGAPLAAGQVLTIYRRVGNGSFQSEPWNHMVPMKKRIPHVAR